MNKAVFQRRAMTLRVHLMLFAAGLVFGTAVSCAAAAVWFTAEREIAAAQNRFKSVFESFVRTAAESSGTEELLRRYSRIAAGSPGGLSVEYALFGDDGLLLGSSDGRGFGALPSHRKAVKEIAGNNQAEFRLKREISGTAVEGVGPVADAAGHRYELMLQSRIHPSASEFAGPLKAAALLLLLVLSVAAGAGWLLARKFLDPLRRLSEASRHLSLEDGRLPDLPLSGSGDELDDLTRTLNQSFRRVSDSYQKTLQFASDASHELRLPLTAMRVETEVALKRARNIEDYREILESVLEEIGRLEALLNRLLVLTRSDAGGGGLQKKQMEIGELIRRLTEFFGPLAEEKNIRLEWSCGTQTTVWADPSRVEELLANLIDNAVKHAPENGSVSIDAEDKDDGIEIRVDDTGAGVPPEARERIFDRFVRLDEARSRDTGSRSGFGLGLPIARSIAEAHGGRIRCESAPSGGARFVVFLPRGRGQAEGVPVN